MNATAAAKKLCPVRSAPAPTARDVAHRRWFKSNPQLISQLYAANRARVQAWLLRSGIAPHDAEDLCNDVFVVAVRRMHTFEGTASPSTWLCGIARKLAADHRRSARVRREVCCEELPESISDDSPFETFAAQEQRTAVREAVATLKPGPREVIREFMLNERPMEAVAKSLRIPAQTAYARMYAGQRLLKTALA
jgi:RNA polymerase sigma-70 factor (ECF subfamily)